MTDKGRTILFLCKDPGAAEALAPVIESMGHLSDFKVETVAHPVSKYVYDRRNIPSILLDDLNYKDSPRECLTELLIKKRPDLIILGTSVPFPDEPVTPEQYITGLAREQSIPSMCILDFWGKYIERFSDDGLHIQHSFLPDTICALDLICRDDLIRLGVREDRILVTNNPYYDSVVNFDGNSLPSKDIKKDRTNILFVSQPLAEREGEELYRYTQQQLFEQMIKEINKLDIRPPQHIILWIHPKEKSISWEEYLKELLPSVSVAISQDRGASILAHIDLLVTSHSTVVYEALYHGVPCLSLQFGNEKADQLITNKLGLSEPVYSREALKNAFSKLDLVNWRKSIGLKKGEMISKGIFFSDGKATERVITAALERFTSRN